MKCFNITDIDLTLNQHEFEHLVRVDNVFIGSKIISDKQIELLKSLEVEMVIDLKGCDETEFDDKTGFDKYGINYTHFPVTDLSKINFTNLQEFAKLVNHTSGKILVYCASGNRVGALMALNACLICGHPKQRSFDFGVKIGMNRESTQNYIKEVFQKGGFDK